MEQASSRKAYLENIGSNLRLPGAAIRPIRRDSVSAYLI